MLYFIGTHAMLSAHMGILELSIHGTFILQSCRDRTGICIYSFFSTPPGISSMKHHPCTSLTKIIRFHHSVHTVIFTLIPLPYPLSTATSITPLSQPPCQHSHSHSHSHTPPPSTLPTTSTTPTQSPASPPPPSRPQPAPRTSYSAPAP